MDSLRNPKVADLLGNVGARHLLSNVMIAAFAVLTFVDSAGAQSRAALSGLRSVDVQVTVRRECLSADTTTLDATRLAVRRTGVDVVDSSRAVLTFEVRCSTTGPSDAIAIAVHAMLVELVAVPRLGGGPDHGAATWQAGAATLATRSALERQIRAGIAATVDAFEHDWRTANNRRP